jgi:molybdopterin-binding protein
VTKSARLSGITVHMALSARNQIPGTVREVRLGEVMAHVVVTVGNHTIESLISKASAEEMNLRVGDPVHVVIKSTEVMIRKD